MYIHGLLHNESPTLVYAFMGSQTAADSCCYTKEVNVSLTLLGGTVLQWTGGSNGIVAMSAVLVRPVSQGPANPLFLPQLEADIHHEAR